MEKIKKQYFIYMLISVIILGEGCKKSDWYDVKSNKRLAVPTTLKDMQALLDYTYLLNSEAPGNLRETASDGYSVNNVVAETFAGYTRNAYTWSHEQSNENVVDWLSGNFGGYRIVYTANLVIDGLPKIKSNNVVEQEEWNNIQGQALFHRALAFYDLSQTFVPPYEIATLNVKLGIPLRLESDINIPSIRSTVKETYDQIIADLMLAKELLPQEPLYKTRPSKPAVYALLARVYLSMEDYKQSLVFAGMCLESYDALLDYSTLNATTTSNPIIGYNPEIIFYKRISPNSALLFGNILIDQSLFDSYQINDLRKKVFFNYNVATNSVTYKGTYSALGFNQCFSGLATDEIYLIRAECNARDGKVAEAMKDLNILLKKRWSGIYIDMVAMDADDALKKVLEERKKELILRGLRWSDLRRLNRDPRFAITLTRKVGAKTYTLEPNSYKYTFPIPDDVIRLSGLEQNPGW